MPSDFRLVTVDRPDPAAGEVVVRTLAMSVDPYMRGRMNEGPSYARRDAAFALADLCWRTGRRGEAAERYRELAGQVENHAVRRFCLQRAGDAG